MIENLECRRFRNRIDAFIDNELSTSEREEMLRHAQSCPECGKLLKEYQDMISLMPKIDEETVIPTEAAQAWRSAVRDEAEHTRRSANRGWLRALGTVAAAFVVLIGVTGLYRSGYNPASYKNAGYDGANYAMTGDYYAEESGVMLTAAYDSSASNASAPRTAMIEADGAVAGSGETIQQTSDTAERKPVIIRSAMRSMQTTSFDEDSAAIDTLVRD